MIERKRTFERRQVQQKDRSYDVLDSALIFMDAGRGAPAAGGMMFGSWVDEDSRDNGFDEGDAIISPAYIIESILRDVLFLPTAKIDYASFDTAGNTTDGILKDWKFTGGIYQVVNVRDVLESILLQCKSQLYVDPDGKFSIIVYNSSASVNYSDYKFDTTNNITNLEVEETSYDEIVSEVKVNFALDRATGKYRKTSFIKAKKRFSGTYLNEDIDLSEYEWDVDDGTKFQRENACGACTGALAGAGAGSLSNGAYKYKITLCIGATQTEAGTVSNTVTVVDNTADGQIDLTSIPTGNQLIDARKIYRTEAGGSTFKLLATISDNTTTTYRDNIADASLGANAPSSNNTGYYLYTLVDKEVNAVVSVSGNTVTLANVAGDREPQFGSVNARHDDNSQIWIIDMSSDAGDGATADTTREGYAAKAIWRYNAQNKIEVDADWIIDQATAVLLRNYYLDFYYIPHYVIQFDAFLRTSDLKVGNIIEFDDTIMNAYMRLGGQSWSSKKFRVQSIGRKGTMTFSIKAIEI